jgi:hypothetical protein
MEIKELIVISIVVMSAGWLYLVTLTRGREVWRDLKGQDGTWQFIEITGIMWLTFFPIMVIVEMLGNHLSGALWVSFDTIFIALIGGKKLLEMKLNNSKNDE